MEGLALPISAAVSWIICFGLVGNERVSATTRGVALVHAGLSIAQQPMAKKSAWRCMRGENGLPFAAGFNVLHGRVLQQLAFGYDTNSYVDS